MANAKASLPHNSARGCTRGVVLFALVVLVAACSSQPQVPFSKTLEPISFEPGNTYNVTDGRAR